jgi:hypothetical protein
VRRGRAHLAAALALARAPPLPPRRLLAYVRHQALVAGRAGRRDGVGAAAAREALDDEPRLEPEAVLAVLAPQQQALEDGLQGGGAG